MIQGIGGWKKVRYNDKKSRAEEGWIDGEEMNNKQIENGIKRLKVEMTSRNTIKKWNERKQQGMIASSLENSISINLILKYLN